MPRRKKPNDYGTGIPYHEVEALARVLLPEIQAFFESEDGGPVKIYAQIYLQAPAE